MSCTKVMKTLHTQDLVVLKEYLLGNPKSMQWWVGKMLTRGDEDALFHIDFSVDVLIFN